MPPSLSSAFPCAYWLHLSAGSSFVVTRGPMVNDRASQSKSRSAPPLSSAPWGRMLVVTEANLGELCPRSRGCWCAEVEADQRTPERQGLDQRQVLATHSGYCHGLGNNVLRSTCVSTFCKRRQQGWLQVRTVR